MAKTRGGLSASPSSPMPRREQSAIGGASSPPAQDSTVPPSEGGTPSQRRYPTRRPPTDPVPLAAKGKRPAPRPPAKRTKFSGPDEPSQSPHAEPPTEDSQIPVGIPLETVIRRPMIAGPPIEGNLDCRDRSFHSETWFDVEALRQQPELRDSFRLLQRYHIEHLLTPRQFYYPRGAPVVPPPQGAPDMPPPPELPQDEQLPQAQQDEILTDTTPPAPTAHTSVHMPEATLPASPITQPAPPRLGALIADPEHRSGFSYLANGHYSCTPGSDHCYSDPAYHDPSSDLAASEYADTSWA
ncbi:uncharacterized protein LOC109123294 [Vitis vinifera]|uniref:uncharacterized protein LOC109123294 n=1 Tax=Vitis vinifera TaxID=29760 RepID=UPI0008FEC8CF|nr:uncharacterized protein LOC109123294 [Vitis vinifera]|eukprot:XP_019078107.1 PREDICTED: proline-rich protein 36-like [Vitis vinifera]